MAEPKAKRLPPQTGREVDVRPVGVAKPGTRGPPDTTGMVGQVLVPEHRKNEPKSAEPDPAVTALAQTRGQLGRDHQLEY